MNKTIFNKLDDEMLRLLKSYKEEDQEIKFLGRFLNDNSFNSIEGIAKLDLKDALLAFVCAKSKTITYEEMKEMVDSNKSLIDKTDSEKYDSLFRALILDMHPDEYEHVVNGIDYYELAKTSLSLTETNYKADINKLKALFKKDITQFGEANALIAVLKEIQQEQKELSNIMNPKECNTYLKDKYKISEVMNAFKEVADYYNSRIKKIKKENKHIEKQIIDLRNAKKLYRQELEETEITKISKILSLVENKELKKELIEGIHNKNNPIYKEVETEYKKMSNDYKSKIKIILDKYEIKCDVKRIDKSIELEDLEYELDLLKKYGFKDSEEIIRIINNTTKEIVEVINNLFNSGCITLEFINNNVTIFNKDFNNSRYPTLLKNIKVVKDNEINPKLFSKTPEVLLTENEKFIKNFNVLTDYDLKNVLKKTDSYRFLSYDNLDRRIDKILELGFENYILEDLSLLNYNDVSWNKLYIMKEIGETPTTLKELKKMLKDNNLIMDSELDEYICSYSEENNDELDLDRLEEFSNTNRTYNFNGVLISKNKVCRNSINNKTSLNYITKESVLSEDEYNIIKGSIFENTK